MTVQADAGFDVALHLGASLDALTAEMRQHRAQQARLSQQVTPFVVSGQAIALTAGAGTLDQPNVLGPRQGQVWDVKRIGAVGFTAGTVWAYLNNVNGDLVVPFNAAGVNYFGTAHMLMQAGDRLVFSATGITGTVTLTIAGVSLPPALLGDYLL